MIDGLCMDIIERLAASEYWTAAMPGGFWQFQAAEDSGLPCCVITPLDEGPEDESTHGADYTERPTIEFSVYALTPAAAETLLLDIERKIREGMALGNGYIMQIRRVGGQSMIDGAPDEQNRPVYRRMREYQLTIQRRRT